MRTRLRRLVLAAFVLAGFAGWMQRPTTTHADSGLSLEAPSVALAGVPFDATLTPSGEDWPAQIELELRHGERDLGRRTVSLRDDDGALLESVALEGLRLHGSGRLTVRAPSRANAAVDVQVIPAWLAILPPLLAILLAVVIREVVVALVAGVWLGATFIEGYDPFTGLLRSADTYAVGALADSDHASIAIFSLLLGGMIGVIAKSGGAAGMAQLVTKVAKDRLRGALATWLMGLAIFFDDYSNSLLVGTTMRPITDRLKISREKLAFLVDATAAPVSSFAVVSSWVGVEVGYIADQYAALGIEGDPYLIFLETIPYRFYPLLMLFFGLAIIVSRRDFGPMHRAEKRALHEGLVSAPGANPASEFDAPELAPPPGKTPRWSDAVIPIVVVIATAMGGMYVTGVSALDEARVAATTTLEQARATLAETSEAASAGVDTADAEGAAEAVASAERALSLLEPNVRNVFGQASSLKALLWAALLGGFVAILLAVGRRTLSLREAMDAWLAGMRSISLAVMILVLAWSLGAICEQLHTAALLIQAIGGWLPPALLPALVFVIAAIVSFATGTSWGTMGILFPLVIPLAHEIGDGAIVLSSVASILSGSVWGDHCSPISDTTIMSSMASSCDHVDHVRTQLPYAMAVGCVSLVVGEVATGFGLWGAPVALVFGCILLGLLVRFAGRRVDAPPEQDQSVAATRS